MKSRLLTHLSWLTVLPLLLLAACSVQFPGSEKKRVEEPIPAPEAIPSEATAPEATAPVVEIPTFENIDRVKLHRDVNRKSTPLDRKEIKPLLRAKKADLTPGPDGSIQAVKDYIKGYARNPDSVRYIKWYPMTKGKSSYQVRCRYKLQGGSLGTMEEDKVFFINRSGQVYKTALVKN